MSIALWAEMEALKRRVAQLESRSSTDNGDVLYRLSERLTALEQHPAPRKRGRPAKTKEHPQ